MAAWLLLSSVLSDTLLVLLTGPVVTKPEGCYGVPFFFFTSKARKPVPYSYKLSQSNPTLPNFKRRYTKIFS
jgi:hypothetical protein